MPSAQRTITLSFCHLHSSDPFFSHSSSWGVRQPSRQTPPSSSWDSLWDVQLAWTKKKKKHLYFWKNSTSILKVCLMRARAMQFPSGLWPHSFPRRKMQASRLGCWTACQHHTNREDRGCFGPAACLPSFICPGSSGQVLAPLLSTSILASRPSVSLTAAEAVFVKRKIRPSPFPTLKSLVTSRSGAKA